MQQFPLNLAALLPKETQRKIVQFVNTNYFWPQIQERRSFEPMWDAILQMYRVEMKKVDSNLEEATFAGKEAANSNGDSLKVADSVFHDAVERLTDITHFVSFKDGIPIQYATPRYFDTRLETQFYSPTRDKVKGGNALLQWNFDNEDVYRKHLILARHFYTYGLCFASSEFELQVKNIPRQNNLGQSINRPELCKVGTTFDPISIRRLFLNYRVSAYDMESQPCPFWYDVVPRFSLFQNYYDPNVNPFGFANLDLIKPGSVQWLFTEQETASERRALEEIVNRLATLQNTRDGQNGGTQNLAHILQPQHSVEAKFKSYPMLPLDPDTGDFETYSDGRPVPYFRYNMETWGSNTWGNQILLRLQRNYIPRDQLPLYGSSHLPDMDSGLYTPSLGFILWNHYKEICTCMNQYIANKDWINNPPSWIQASSPSRNENLNKPGAKLVVNGPNDFGWRQPYDATGSTVNMIQFLRESAQTTAKSVDALLGKAMGGRTSATEAENAFQAAMSAVTTPINLFTYDMMGGFANRVWDYTGSWFDKDLLKAITGQMGFELTPEDMWLRIGLKWDIGSTFVESIVRQQHIQQALQTAVMDPMINRAKLWKDLFIEWKFPNAADYVDDQGMDHEIAFATLQVIQTLEGDPMAMPVNPDQNHQIAIKIITSFLEDRESTWMKKYNQNAPLLQQRAMIHQKFLEMQMQLAQLQMHEQQLTAASMEQAAAPERPQPQPAKPAAA